MRTKDEILRLDKPASSSNRLDEALLEVLVDIRDQLVFMNNPLTKITVPTPNAGAPRGTAQE